MSGRGECDYGRKAEEIQERVFARCLGGRSPGRSRFDVEGDGERDSSANATIGGRKVVVARGGEFVEVEVEPVRPAQTIIAQRRTGNAVVRKTTESRAPKPVPGKEPEASVPPVRAVVEPPKPPPPPRLSADEVRQLFDDMRRCDAERARQRELQAPPVTKPVVVPAPVSPSPSKKKTRAGRGATLAEICGKVPVKPAANLAPVPIEEPKAEPTYFATTEPPKKGWVDPRHYVAPSKELTLEERIGRLDDKVVTRLYRDAHYLRYRWPSKAKLLEVATAPYDRGGVDDRQKLVPFVEACETAMRSRKAG